MSRSKRNILLAVLVMYLAVVLWYTVLHRPIEMYSPQFELFWSYKKWFAGDWELGREILSNIAMFVPLGFLLTALGSKRNRSLFCILVSAILFSLLIEILQLMLVRGLFEWDDLVNNTAGALLGWGLYLAVEKTMPEQKLYVGVLAFSTVFAVICIIVFVREGGEIRSSGNNMPRSFCFQIDDAAMENGAIRLRGFIFRYGLEPSSKISLVLCSTETGKKSRLSVDYGSVREDVNTYFLCDHDYTNIGFKASGEIAADEEYEVMVQWPWTPEIATGVYLTGDKIHYASEKEFQAPACEGRELERIVGNGVLRVYQPNNHCWVYQSDQSLYWIVDHDFVFEDDGTTLIQYQLWTTQIEKLPEKRLAHENYWDNISGYFEEYELEGNFGPYRVMKRELPNTYSITAITTGYYKNGEWIWRNCFRPRYDFKNLRQG